VQSGVGRTLVLYYAYEQFRSHSLSINFSESASNGFPVWRDALATEKAAKKFAFATHWQSYGGNPMACAICRSRYDIIDTPEVLAGVL